MEEYTRSFLLTFGVLIISMLFNSWYFIAGFGITGLIFAIIEEIKK